MTDEPAAVTMTAEDDADHRRREDEKLETLAGEHDEPPPADLEVDVL
jgi:hypothetical protein